MKTKTSFKKISYSGLILILVLIILLFPAVADNNSTSGSNNNTTSIANNSNNVTNIEYFLIVGDDMVKEMVKGDRELNISADSKLKFRIWDNKSEKFAAEGTINIRNENLEIKWNSLWDKAKEIFGVGNNSGYFVEYNFNESLKAENYSVEAIGKFNSISTNNKIIINVQSNYITQTVGNSGKTYNLESMKTLNNRELKYHKNNTQNVNNIVKNATEFLAACDILQNKINNLTNHPEELKNLPINKVVSSQESLDKSLKEYESKANDDKLIKEQLIKQLNLIKQDKNNVTSELVNNLKEKKDILLEKQLKDAQTSEEKKTNELNAAKSDFRNDVFIPTGALVVLGIIIGYFNVNRWKKESEYFGLYTSKANITSPITIAIILTVVISILILITVYIEGDLNMFKFLI